MTQAKLAATLGISASYLNLIELNKRNIGGALLKRIAGTLGMSLDELDGAAGRRLLDDLRALAADSRLAALTLEAAAIDDLAGRHPGWARALVVLQRAVVDRDRAVAALSDRLSHDPFLGEMVHDVRSRVAAIRSSSEILETVDDLAPAQRQRFVSIIGTESARLSDLAQALAAFFDPALTTTRSITPAEEVDDFLFDHDNHFPALEDAATRLRAAASIDGDCHEAALVAWLRQAGMRDAGAQVDAEGQAPAREREGPSGQAGGGLAGSSPAGEETSGSADGVPRIDPAAPSSTRRFLLARAAVLASHAGGPVAAAVDAAPRLTSEAARSLARRALASYMAAAVLMPYDAFLDVAMRLRYDVDGLARRFDASYEQVCHRLVTLRRPGAEGIPFGFMRADPAGFVTKRFPLPNLLLPRLGNACPLWAVYEAFQNPGATVRQVAAFPAGDRYLFVARAIEKPRPAFTMPRRLVSVMLACDALHADRTVYGDALDLSSSAPGVPVGPNCRLCARRECVYREEAPIIAS